jgi:hypothetical protein
MGLANGFRLCEVTDLYHKIHAKRKFKVWQECFYAACHPLLRQTAVIIGVYHFFIIC